MKQRMESQGVPYITHYNVHFNQLKSDQMVKYNKKNQ